MMMYHAFSTRSLLHILTSAAILAILCPRVLARPAAEAQLVTPPTLSCGPCDDSGDHPVKWCQRCTMNPVHCTLKFSVACSATIDRNCVGDVMDCVHDVGAEGVGDDDDDCDDEGDFDGGRRRGGFR